MNIKEAMQWGRQQLAATPTAAGDARLLLQTVLQVGRAHLVAHAEQLLTEQQEARFREFTARAAQGEPVPYLAGTSPFYGLDFVVTPEVLIPRPETELLVEAALAWARAQQATRIVDVGTGSGCIAVTLARQLPQAQIGAVDRSASALAVARQNADRHGVRDRIRFYRGSLLAPLPYAPHLVVANLPYVADAEWTELDDGVKLHEPAGALRGGADGLALIRQLLRQAAAQDPVPGALFLEIGWRQGRAAHALARSFFPDARIEVRPDYAGHDRIVVVET